MGRVLDQVSPTVLLTIIYLYSNFIKTQNNDANGVWECVEDIIKAVNERRPKEEKPPKESKSWLGMRRKSEKLQTSVTSNGGEKIYSSFRAHELPGEGVTRYAKSTH